MNNTQFVRKTPFGNIVVTTTGSDEEFPGVVIEVNNDVIARVEFNTLQKELSAMLWERHDADYTHKVTHDLPFMKDTEGIVLFNADIEHIMHELSDEYETTLTQAQHDRIQDKLQNYDFSEYNSYIEDLIRDELEKTK